MNSICAVIVTYNPDCTLIENVAAVVSQVSSIVVVDNGSTGDSVQILEELEKFKTVEIVYNGENLGIAVALNIGVRRANTLNVEWVATFDQDSTVPDHYFSTMLGMLEKLPFKNKVAIVAPQYRDKATKLLASFSKSYAGTDYFEVDTVITSGNLVKVSALYNIGGFDETFFIDAVDHDFCLRLRLRGYRIIISCSTELAHSIGIMERHHLFGKVFKVSNHSPLRRYYNARNRVVVYRRYLRNFPGWVCRDVVNWTREVGGIILFESDPCAKLTSAFKGILDGITGRMGKI